MRVVSRRIRGSESGRAPARGAEPLTGFIAHRWSFRHLLLRNPRVRSVPAGSRGRAGRIGMRIAVIRVRDGPGAVAGQERGTRPACARPGSRRCDRGRHGERVGDLGRQQHRRPGSAA